MAQEAMDGRKRAMGSGRRATDRRWLARKEDVATNLRVVIVRIQLIVEPKKSVDVDRTTPSVARMWTCASWWRTSNPRGKLASLVGNSSGRVSP